MEEWIFMKLELKTTHADSVEHWKQRDAIQTSDSCRRIDTKLFRILPENNLMRNILVLSETIEEGSSALNYDKVISSPMSKLWEQIAPEL